MNGSGYENNGSENKKQKGKIIAIVVAAIVCVAVAAGVAVFALSQKSADKNSETNSTSESGYSTEKNGVEPSQTSESGYSKWEGTDEAESDISTSESTGEVTSKTEETKKKPVSNELVRPEKSKVCSEYRAYVYCTDEDVQSYVKMRFGPSTADYDIVTTINNCLEVIVESVNVNGWTFCSYEDYEGWIKTAFLFKDYPYCSGTLFIVSIEEKYADEPLNLRAEADKNSELITTVPNGSRVYAVGPSFSINGWTKVDYNGYIGWVLTKYLMVSEGVGDKPVLYLYPEKTTDVNVKVNLKNMNFSCTYPPYNNGWSVTAKPDGTLTNKADGKEYSYLYWELQGKANYDFSEGFVVKGEDTREFLQTVLPKMGLTPREYNEFIVYWLPKMQNNRYNLISFQTTAYTDNCQLNISPKPDSMLRVFMAYKPLDSYVSVPEQKITSFERKGFTVVEWGGAEVK